VKSERSKDGARPSTPAVQAFLLPPAASPWSNPSRLEAETVVSKSADGDDQFRTLHGRHLLAFEAIDVPGAAP
jgi:hypothetical protein